MNNNVPKAIVSCLAITLTPFIATSCSDVNSVSHEGFPQEYTLLGDSVSKQANTYVNYYIHFVDGNVILPGPINQSDTLLHIYSTPDLKLRLSTGVKGHSKNEFQSSPQICNSTSSNVFIKGYTPNSLRKVCITDSSLVDSGHFKLYTPCAPNHMHMIDDSLLYYANFSKNKITSYNINTQKDVHEFAIPTLYASEGQSLHGSLCVNNRLAVYAMQYKREIVVLKTDDLSYVKTIKGEYENQDEAIDKKSKDYTIYYTGAFATKDRFYLLYRGFKMSSSEKKSSIEVYDKDMTPVCTYHLKPELNRFVVDEKNGYIYGLGENSDYIYRFKFQ